MKRISFLLFFLVLGSGLFSPVEAQPGGDQVVPKVEAPAPDGKATPLIGGTGTAFVVHPDGYLLTNAHVVQTIGKKGPQVEEAIIEVLLNKRLYEARVVAVDVERDLAVLKIEAKDLPSLPLANSEDAQLGEEIRAFGYPLGFALGVSTPKVTRGTISGIEVTPKGKEIQTDTTINPGNSGGPIINAAGEVLGVVTAKIVRADVSNIGFCVPINDGKQLLKKAGVQPKATLSAEKVEGVKLVKRVLPAVALVKNTPLLWHFTANEEKNTISNVAISPNGQYLATASVFSNRDNQIRVWSIPSCTLWLSLDVRHAASSPFFPDSKRLAIPVKNRVVIFDILQKKPVGHLTSPTEESIRLLAISPDGNLVATTSFFEKEVRIWNVADERIEHTFKTARDVTSLEFSPDSAELLTREDLDFNDATHKNVRIWDAKSGKLAKVFAVPYVLQATYMPGGKSLAASVRLDEKAGYCCGIWTLDGIRSATLDKGVKRSLAVSDSGKILASNGYYGGIEVFDTAAGKSLLRSWEPGGFPKFVNPGNGEFRDTESVAISRDGNLVVTGHHYGMVRCTVWQEKIRFLPRVVEIPLPDRILDKVAFSPSGNELVCVRNEHGGKPNQRLPVTLFVVDTLSGAVTKTITANEQTVAIAWSNNGRYLVSAGKSVDKGQFQATLWDTKTWKALPPWTLDSSVSVILEVAFSPDDKHVAFLNNAAKVDLWSIETGRLVKSFSSPGVAQLRSLVFSPNGKLMATGGEKGEVALLDVDSGKARPVKLASKQAWCLAFSPDSRLLTGGSFYPADEIKIWNVNKGEVERTLPLPDPRRVDAVAFSPDGRNLLVNSDNTLTVWSTATWKQTQEFHGNGTHSIGFAADRKTALWVSEYRKTIHRITLK